MYRSCPLNAGGGVRVVRTTLNHLLCRLYLCDLLQVPLAIVHSLLKVCTWSLALSCTRYHLRPIVVQLSYNATGTCVVVICSTMLQWVEWVLRDCRDGCSVVLSGAIAYYPFEILI